MEGSSDSRRSRSQTLSIFGLGLTPKEFLTEALPRLRKAVLHVGGDLGALGRAEEIGLDLHRARDLVERLRGEMRVDPEDGQRDVEARHDVEQVAGQTAGGAVA